jgi:hypothetical protein
VNHFMPGFRDKKQRLESLPSSRIKRGVLRGPPTGFALKFLGPVSALLGFSFRRYPTVGILRRQSFPQMLLSNFCGPNAAELGKFPRFSSRLSRTPGAFIKQVCTIISETQTMTLVRCQGRA